MRASRSGGGVEGLRIVLDKRPSAGGIHKLNSETNFRHARIPHRPTTPVTPRAVQAPSPCAWCGASRHRLRSWRAPS
eukprot:7502306-Pyramimonas_sp.AAC.1